MFKVGIAFVTLVAFQGIRAIPVPAQQYDLLRNVITSGMVETIPTGPNDVFRLASTNIDNQLDRRFNNVHQTEGAVFKRLVDDVNVLDPSDKLPQPARPASKSSKAPITPPNKIGENAKNFKESYLDALKRFQKSHPVRTATSKAMEVPSTNTSLNLQGAPKSFKDKFLAASKIFTTSHTSAKHTTPLNPSSIFPAGVL